MNTFRRWPCAEQRGTHDADQANLRSISRHSDALVITHDAEQANLRSNSRHSDTLMITSHLPQQPN
jgi:hypothetical protein